ncbi:glycosyl-transferase for dystroglycan-domain-containing protein [Jimgerdemannia flammicorona]|uniref:Glycosyl-transferase for dystroglycan-domain-containing protein n=1 Tax=Jimgerdemannia flammicorona TaxID=994334 RepID=A0A433QY23_9FUNG|nr:glycosyl-transferase for dystroglycan-domain-containing protein [Jimgerdemannia flammicorona]
MAKPNITNRDRNGLWLEGAKANADGFVAFGIWQPYLSWMCADSEGPDQVGLDIISPPPCPEQSHPVRLSIRVTGMDTFFNRTQVRLDRIWRQWARRRRHNLPYTAAKRPLTSQPQASPTRALLLPCLLLFALILFVWPRLGKHVSPAQRPDSAARTPHHEQYHGSTSAPSVTICNPTNRCSSWLVGRWDWQALVQQGVYHDVHRVSVPVGMSLTLEGEPDAEAEEERWDEEGEKSQQRVGKSVVLNVGEFSCDSKKHSLCKLVREIEVKTSIFIALDQIKRNMTRKHAAETEIIYTHPPTLAFPSTEVTLVSQFSINRLERFEDAIGAWEGPIAAVIYLTQSTDIDPLHTYFNDAAKSALYSRVTLTILKPAYDAHNVHLRYPINRLRNLATATAPTDYVFVIDADFVPSKSLHAFAAHHAVPLLSPRTQQAHRIALVIPCIALVEAHMGPIPATPADLRPLFRTGAAFVTDPRAGHGPTLTTQQFLARPFFAQDPHTYEVCYESQWEPYYILHRSTAPAYDERFRNQGGDKQSHALILNAMGYRFRVARGEFIVHREHAKLVWPGGGLGKAQKEEKEWTYFDGFMREVEETFGKGARWPRGCAAKGVGWTVQRRDVVGIGVGGL